MKVNKTKKTISLRNNIKISQEGSCGSRRMEVDFATLRAEMKADSANNYPNKTRRILNTGGSYLPNCDDFMISTGNYSVIGQRLGVYKKVGKKVWIKEHLNGPANRYMEFQIRRLQKLSQTSDPGFGKIVFNIMSKSVVFRVAALNHVLPNGARRYSFNYIMNVLKKVSRILKDGNFSDNLDFKRIYISKPSKPGESRPLGVPKPEGRIALHMLNNFLEMGIDKHLLPTQHGYRSGKGCLSCGKDIFQSKLYKKKYILETDLKSFFEKVSVIDVSTQLRNWKTPSNVVTGIENLNRNSPELPENYHSMDERFVERKEGERLIRQGNPIPRAHRMITVIEKYCKQVPSTSLAILESMQDLDCTSIQEGVQYQWAFLEQGFSTILPPDVIGDALGNYFEGVPQGANTSPLLSICTLVGGLTKHKNIKGGKVHSISYADDPVFFSDDEFSISGNISLPKTHWVKGNGSGLKPLQHVGLQYDGRDDTFRANTHKGVIMECSKDVRDYFNLLDKLATAETPRIGKDPLTGHDYSHSSGEQLHGNKVIGFIQSRMYQGAGNLDVDQNFEFTFNTGSGVDQRRYHKQRPHGTVFNITSISSHSLINLLHLQQQKAYGRYEKDEKNFFSYRRFRGYKVLTNLGKKPIRYITARER